MYINNQVLVPANLARSLGLDKVKYVDVVMEYNGYKIEINNVRLLRTRHTASRQFTIPREVREKFGIKSFDEVIIQYDNAEASVAFEELNYSILKIG